jgi:hypothetical protein
MTIGTAGFAGAQSTYGDAQMKPKGDQSDFRAQNPDKCKPGMRESKVDWKFDPNRHERRKSRDATFRFHFGGYWYPQPYWLGRHYGLVVNPRISCGEGRFVVRNRGFNRVRPIECRGRIYTYFGRRHGDNYRVELNARTGRIVDIDSI